jgi:hypothetical protein
MSRPKKPTAANHPLIAALFQELPTPGTVWPYQKRVQWTNALQTIFSIVYSDDAPSANFQPGVRGGIGQGVGQPGPGNISGPGRQFIDAGLSLSERSENEEEDI